MSINKVILVGDLCSGIEQKTLTTGQTVFNFRLLTEDSYEYQGETKIKKEYHNISCYDYNGYYAKLLNQCIEGNTLQIEGSLHTISWDDANGKKNYKTQIKPHLIKKIKNND